MRYLLFWPFWVINCSHTQSNNSDIIIKYEGHSEVRGEEQNKIEKLITTDIPDTEITEDIVFIPNEKPVYRNEDLDGLKVSDVINTRRVEDLVRDRIQISDTEAPNKEILFITGQNNEDSDIIVKQKEKPKNKQRSDAKHKNKRIDCNNLDCNRTINSVCGEKIENNQVKNRLFLNECYFRKVNCGFQYPVNRYSLVTIDKCKNIGAHSTRTYEAKPMPMIREKILKFNETRRIFASRRSLSKGIDGIFCDHSCPVSCTEDYDPQCAVSDAGQRKVFLNHCKLDENSCLHRLVWHLRPLSECVGGKKADVNQNRGFISWMQKVGIVDRRGRLVLD